MKKFLFAGFLLVFAVTVASAQQTDQLVTIRIKNSSLLPRKITVISYQPGDTGNGTTGVLLLPVGTRKFKFKDGTKIYIATDEQVGTVMSGKRIDQDKPFLVVKKEQNGKSFKL